MRVVLDTNIVVSALLFEHGRLSWLRQTWMEAGIVPLLDEPCAAELVRVLTYPRFELDAEDIQTLLGDFLPYVETVAPGPAPRLPRCRDKHDQKFLQFAARGKAKVLVTGDKALLALAGQVNFSILTAAELKQSLG